MGSLGCLLSSATALRRVFVNDTISLAPTWQPHRLLVPALGAMLLRRPYMAYDGNTKSSTKNGVKTNLKLRRLPRDHEIKDEYVYIRKEDGGVDHMKLSQPLLTLRLLRELDLEKQSLVTVVMPKRSQRKSDGLKGEQGSRDDNPKQVNEGQEDDNGDDVNEGRSERDTEKVSRELQWPICRIIDRKAEFQRQQEREKVRKRNMSSKELEVNWAIAPNDLKTRLKQLQDFLISGFRVDVRMLNKASRKSGKRAATIEEAEATLRTVREAVAEIPGAREYKAISGKVGRQASLSFEVPETMRQLRTEDSVSGEKSEINEKRERKGERRRQKEREKKEREEERRKSRQQQDMKRD